MALGPDAFTLSIITEEVPEKIECISVWKDKVLAGLYDGSVVLYEPEFEEQTVGPWRLVHHAKGIGKKTLTQMDVSKSIPAILTLSDEGVKFHQLPNFELIDDIVPNSKSALKFAWNEDKLFLAVANKRRIYFYHLKNKSIIELNYLLMTDIVLAMEWFGDRLCLGFKKEYMFANPNNGELKTIFTANRTMKPCITPAPEQELLLLKDNYSVFIEQSGEPRKHAAIAWTEIPNAIYISDPYVIALLNNFIEVKNLNMSARQCVIQTFPIEDMKMGCNILGKDNSIFVASRLKKQICRLQPIPIDTQIENLIKMKEFEDALQLSYLLEEPNCTEKEDVIRLRYGVQLFSNGEFDDAMNQFSMRSKKTPLIFLRMFPSLVPIATDFNLLNIPDEFFDEYIEPTGEEFTYAVTLLLPYLIAARSRLAQQRRDDIEEEYENQLPPLNESSSVSSIEVQEDLGYDANAVYNPSAVGRAFASKKVISVVRRNKISVIVDTAIMNAMLILSDTGQLLEFVRKPNAIDLDEAIKSLTKQGRYAELYSLYQTHNKHDEGLETLRKLSQCPEEFEVAPTGIASELKGRTGIWAAIRYLSKMTELDTAVIQKHSKWVLQNDAEAAMEVFIGAERRLPPSVVLPILSEHAPHFSTVYLETMLDRGDVYPIEYHGMLVNFYLKEAIKNEKKLGTMHLVVIKEANKRFDFDTLSQKSKRRLLQKDDLLVSKEAIKDVISKLSPKSDNSNSCEYVPPTPVQSYVRLKELIQTSPYIKHKLILETIPSDSLLEIQALLLERRGLYKNALEIYIQKLNDLSLAEDLCDRVYESFKKPQRTLSSLIVQDQSIDEAENVYMILLKTYLEPREPSKQEYRELSDDEWKELSLLLSKKRYRINIEGMFNLLPGSVELGVIINFLEATLRTMSELQRNLSIVHNLHVCENLNVKEQLIRCNQKMIVVTPERACSICRKRIENSVFVAYPDSSLAHYVCYRRKTTTD